MRSVGNCNAQIGIERAAGTQADRARQRHPATKVRVTPKKSYLRLRNESRRLRRPMLDLAEAEILADDLERKKGVEA